MDTAKMPTRSAFLLALASPFTLADSAQSQANGFVQDSAWSVLNRTVYDHREYRHGARAMPTSPATSVMATPKNGGTG